MKVGIEAVDDDHRTLFAIIDEIDILLGRDGPIAPAALADILTRLDSYVRIHFRREEEIQDEVGYEGLEENRRHHGELARTLEAFGGRIRHDLDLGADARATAATMRSFLAVWITEHVVKVDRKMRGRILPWCG
jgi:hemerythrin